MSGISINGPRILFTLPIFGGMNVTETAVGSFLVTLLILVGCIILTRNLSKHPVKKTQIIAEKIVLMIENLVITTMGKSRQKYTPYVMTILLSSIIGSLISLWGLRSVTADINTTLTWAVMTFVMIQYAGIKSKGVLKHYKGLLEPFPFMLPLNLISELSLPVSLGFRHFGNILSGMIISTLVYAGLAGLTTIIFGVSIPFLQIGVPAFLSLYFDLFSAVMQAFIFSMLTMVFISSAAE